jgi:hypothetical protein
LYAQMNNKRKMKKKKKKGVKDPGKKKKQWIVSFMFCDKWSTSLLGQAERLGTSREADKTADTGDKWL